MNHLHSYIVLCILMLSILLSSTDARTETFYVSTNGLHKIPFADWTDAATNIQSAVNLAKDTDTVYVSNGYYTLSKSKGGADATIIDADMNGRCLYVNSIGAEINGFTFQNGYVYGEWPSNAGAGILNTVAECAAFREEL